MRKLHILFLFAVLIVGCGAADRHAQESNIRGLVTTSVARGSGNAAKIGAGLAFNFRVPADVLERARLQVILGGRIEAFRRPKQYVGDGHGFNTEIYSRLTTHDRVYAEIGFEKTWFTTSQYSKSAQNIFVGGGVHLVPNQQIMGARYYFPDPTNFDVINGQPVGNRTKGIALYSEHYFPISGRTWIYFSPQLELFQFYQPPGYPNEGKHNITQFKFNFGVAWGPQTPERKPRQIILKPKLPDYYNKSMSQEIKQ